MDKLPSVVSAPAPAGGMFWDYNRKAKAFWWTVVGLGGITIVHSVLAMGALPGDLQAVTALGLAFVAITAMFPINLTNLHEAFGNRPQSAPTAQIGARSRGKIVYSLGDLTRSFCFSLAAYRPPYSPS